MWAEQSVTGRANPAPIGGVIPLAMADAGVEMQVIVDPSLVGGFVLEIPKGAKNPEGSYECIKYATSYEVQDFLCTSLGDFSGRNDFTEDSEFFQKPLVGDIAKALEETTTVIVPNSIKGYQDVINPIIDEGTLGIKSTDQALDEAQQAFADFKATHE